MTLPASLQYSLNSFISQEGLPADYADTVQQWFLPLAEDVLKLVAHSRQAPIVGVSGCQGSGKSTLAALLVLLAREMMGLRAINLSIDDFYHTHATRQELARAIHPLFATRGVPGTHDVDLAIATLQSLRQEGKVRIPRFDKAMDDRKPREQWPELAAPVDLIVLEGWCLSVPAQDEQSLLQSLNTLEAEEDTGQIWRRHVNDSIRLRYAPLYDMVDFLVFLKAPDFARVAQWRGRQESKLAANTQGSGHRIMGPDALSRFIQHYERLTRHGLQVLPERADVVFALTDEQTIAGRN